MNRKKFIVFGEGNYNSLGVLHQLADCDVEAVLLIIGSARDYKNGNIIGYSNNANNIVEVDSEEAGLKWIFDHINSFPKGSYIYPTSDITERLLDLNFDKLHSKFIFPNCGNKGVVSELMDKSVQIERAEQFGLRVLKSQYSNSKDFDIKNVTYPCMVKPVNSTTGSKIDMRVCENAQDLESALINGRYTSEFIVQQYIRNEADLLFLGIRFNNGDVYIPAVVIKPGVSAVGEYTHAIISTNVIKYLPEIESVKKFVKSLNYYGPFSIEFGLENGMNYFFEINLRNDGTSHYPLNAGVNIAKAFVLDAPVWDNQLIEYNMVDEVADIRRVFTREISLLEWCKMFKNAGSYRYYYSKDNNLKKPLFKMFLHRFLGKIVRSCHIVL